MPEVECCECGWEGDADELLGDTFCPACGSDDIQDYEDELETTGNVGFGGTSPSRVLDVGGGPLEVNLPLDKRGEG